MQIKSRKKLVYIVLLLYGLVIFTMNLGNSVMPAFLKATPYGTSIFGFLMAFLFLGQFLIAPIWGMISDKKGRLILAISPLGYGLGQVLYALSANSLTLLVFSRIFSGFFSILFLSQYVAYISDVTPEKSRQKVLAITAIMAPLGAGFAYLVGGLLKSKSFSLFALSIRGILNYVNVDISYKLTQPYTFSFVLQLVFGIILTVVLYVLMRHNNQYQLFNKQSQQGIQIFQQFTTLSNYKNTLVLPVIAISFFNNMAYCTTQSIQYYLQDALNLSTQYLGLVVFIYSISSVVISLFIQPLLIKKNSKWYNLLLANGTVVFLSIALCFANVSTLTVVMSFIIMMNTMLVSIIQTVLVEQGTETRGVLLGLNQSAMSLGSILGNFIISPIYAVEPSIFQYKLPFIFMAAVLLIVTLIILLSLRKKMANYS